MRRPGYSVDLVLLTPLDRHLAVLLVRSPDGSAERWSLPWGVAKAGDATLDDAASRVAKGAVTAQIAWMDQVGAFADSRRHPSDAELSIAFVGAVPIGTHTRANDDSAWFPVVELPPLSPRQRAIIEASVGLAKTKIDSTPVAFRLLPQTFTLSDLQRVYEILLGQKLHKASFRRALQAATLVEATDEWRSEGRGRPAQLFRYAPKRRRRVRRGLRFDLISYK
jgi:8-oxo-dGTP diphosphatase